MFAITTLGIGCVVTARAILSDWDLVEGESFKVEIWVPGMILDDDGVTVRHPTLAETTPTNEQVLASKIKIMDDAIRERLNSQAVSMGFESIASALISAALPLGEYKQSEGAALLLWSARTWQKAEQIRNEFLSGQINEPAWGEVEAELPAYPIE